MLPNLLDSMKQRYPEVPAAAWAELAREVKAEEFVGLAALIYAKHLTVDEMQQLQAFYESPIGQKVLQAMPAILQESVVAGQEWGREVAARILRRLKEQGHAGKTRAD